MNYKFDAKVLSNEDVIATSCDSHDLLLVQIDEGNVHYEVYKNNDGDYIKEPAVLDFLKNEEDYTEEGFYHVDSQGNITGPCPSWDGVDEGPVARAHHVGG